MRINFFKIRECYKYTIAIILLLFNYTSYYCFLGKITKEEVMIIPLIIVGAIFLYDVVISKNIYASKQSAIVLGILYINAFISSMFDRMTFSAELWMLLVAILVAFMLNKILEKDEIINCYVNVITLLAIYSLIATYIFLPLYMKGKLSVFPVYNNNSRNFLDMYFSMAMCTDSIPRNCGFCREPGVYQFFLLIAIFFSIEYKEKTRNNACRILILVFTLLSTFSAVAYITAAVSILMFLRKYSDNSKRTISIYFVTLLLIFILYKFVIANAGIYGEFLRTFGKWGSSSASNSLSVRLSGIISNLSLFAEKPLLGYGLVTSWVEIIERYGYADVTGTSLIGFSAFGIVFGTITHCLFWKSCRTGSLINSIVWFMILLLSSLSQNLFIANLFWVFLFLGI